MTKIMPRLESSSRSPLAKMACIGLILQSLSACEQKPLTPDKGDIFPLASLDMLPILTDSRPDLADKTLLINFWATWCAPCREEMPYLQQLSARLDPALFAVIGVTVDEDANLVREFLLQYEIRFHNYQDARAALASDQLGLLTYPQTFVVTPQGVIALRIDEAIPRGWNLFDSLPELRSDSRYKPPAATVGG